MHCGQKTGTIVDLQKNMADDIYSFFLFHLHTSGVSFILWLQQVFLPWETSMVFLSHLGDPGNAFLVYFPIMYCLNTDVGIDVLWAAALSEWVNLISKWFLCGERPYWWVHESGDARKSQIQQFKLTCETGPGSPSGHVMVTAAVWLIITVSMIKYLRRIIPRRFHNVCQVMLWLFFSLLMTSVALSRVFIATHFPHQVILGLITALAVVGFSRKGSVYKNAGMGHYLIVSFILIFIALVLYLCLSMLIFDPSASVEKATRWCSNPSYIHLDTNPFHALVRDVASILGLGIGLWLQYCLSLGYMTYSERKASMNYHNSNGILKLCKLSLRMGVIVFIVQLLERISLPTDPLLFYILAFFKWTLIPVIVLSSNFFLLRV